MKLVGIIGHPVGHSLSPVFQQAAFDALGIDARYEAWDTPLEQLAARVASLRAPACLGGNVTIPHKEAAAGLVDELDPQAVRMAAVNTIVNRGGRLLGYNTDGAALAEAMGRECGFDVAGKSILLVGAGGAARGIAFAFAAAGAAAIAIWNRSPERAGRLARDVTAMGTATAVGVVAEPRTEGFDAIVNCTSVGMSGTGTEGDSPCRFERARPGALAVDIVYRPAETAFLGAAKAAGLASLGGLPMLIYQGALAFTLWTGRPAPVDVMFAAARARLAE